MAPCADIVGCSRLKKFVNFKFDCHVSVYVHFIEDVTKRITRLNFIFVNLSQDMDHWWAVVNTAMD